MTAVPVHGQEPSVRAIVEALACGRRCCCRALAAGHGRVHCPAHDPTASGDPDLDVKRGDRQPAVVVCRVGCSQDAVISELQARALWPPPRRGEVVPLRPAVRGGRTAWDIRGDDGELLARHVRIERPGGRKSFVWQHPDGRRGMPDGLKPADLLYGAEQLADLPDGATIVLTEGEKAADAVRAAGLVAVGTVTGASGTPSDAVLSRLARFDMALWPDNEETGDQHVRRIARRGVALGWTPRWVSWDGAPPKGDAADATPDEVRQLVADAVVCTPAFLSAGTSYLIPAETIPLFVSASDFARATPEQPEWIASPYVARGSITEVAGKLKASGKTTWLLAMCRKVLDGQPFMGFPTTRTGVIYLTEQAGTSFRASLARADLLDRDDFLIVFWHRVRSLDWPAIVQAAAGEAKRRGYGLIVVDTLPQFSGVSGDNENSAGAALDAMKPLQEAAADDLAIVVARHERKGGGEVGESGRGSSAYSGAVDIVASIRRPEGHGADAVRVIQALGRFDDTPPELVVELVDGTYVARGTQQAVKAQQARVAILEQLPRAEGDALTIAELAEALADQQIRRTTVMQVLDELLHDDFIRRSGEGKRGSPYRFWIHSAGAPVVPAESISAPAEIVDEEV